MSVLVIGEFEKREIKKALKAARAKPVPWDVLKSVANADDGPTLKLKDRKPGIDEIRKEYPHHSIMLGTYRVAISFEEQPAGMMRHLSISSYKAGSVPGEEVVSMVLQEFGFSGWPLKLLSRIWLEEYEQGAFAVNVVEIVQEEAS